MPNRPTRLNRRSRHRRNLWGRPAFSLTALLLALAVALVGVDSEAAKRRQPSAEDQMEFGVQMAKRQLWSEALFRFEQALRLDPGNARVYNNLAVAAEATGQFDQALEYYREALKRDPGNRDLRQNYSRFVEFYQSFKPPTEDETEEAAEGETP